MTKKPTSLADALTRKPSAVAPAPSAAPATAAETKMLSFRVPGVVQDQLRELAFTSRRTNQSLVFEALNLLFEKHGRPPIAPAG